MKIELKVEQRDKHELPSGITCNRCKNIYQKYDYVAVKYMKTKEGSTSGESKTILHINLCNKCFNDYQDMMSRFLGGNNE